MRKTLAGLLALFTVGCASSSGVIPMGKDTYLVSRQAATGIGGTASLKAEAIQEGNAFCVSKGRQIQVVKATESQPPYLLGNYPRAEVEFSCLEDRKPGSN